ncbi:MAG: GNAT family N-acetyltransferase [Clostridia bacterium]
MIHFDKVTIQAMPAISEYVKACGSIGSDYCWGSWLSWYDVEKIEWAKQNDAVYIKAAMDGETVFLSPLTSIENYAEAINEIHRYAVAQDIPFKVVFATEQQVNTVKNFKLSTDLGNSEYLYNPSDLINLQGKKYHAKRNHIYRFTSSYDFIYRAYNDNDFNGVVDLMNLWGENRERISFEEEKKALIGMLVLGDMYKHFVDVIEIDGRIVAVSVGELTSANVGVVLFEKADMSFEGIYTFLSKTFAEIHFKDTLYIDRQEDMNIDGLRRAKQSYYPIMLLHKYTITENDEIQLFNLYSEAFDDSEAYRKYFSNVMKKQAEVISIEENGTIVSALYLFNKLLCVADIKIPCAFVTAVATLKKCRNKGYMAQLMDKAILNLYEREIPLALLYPFKPDFYCKFGFASIDKVSYIKIEFNPNSEYRAVKTDDLNELKSAYDNFAKGSAYYIERSEQDFEARLAELKVDDGRAYVIYKNNVPQGYFLYKNEVEEGAYSSEMLSCVEFLNGETVMIISDNGISGAQARIINCNKLVEILNDKSSQFNCNIVDDVICSKYLENTNNIVDNKLSLTDDIVEQNNINLIVQNTESANEVSDNTRENIKLNILELTEAVFAKFEKSSEKNGFIVDRY